MRRIKKYGNRRLYDTESSAYVNLEQLADLIRAGEEVRVEDAKTGEDLTAPVLLQVLLEAEGAIALFPPGLLHRLVRATGQTPYHHLALQQLATGMRLLDAQMAQIEKQLGWMAGRSAPPPPPRPETEPAPPPAEAAPERPEEDLDALRARLAALEARLDGRKR